MPPKLLQNIRNVIVLTCRLGISDLLLSLPGTIWAEITMRELCEQPWIPKLKFWLCYASFDCARRFVFGPSLRSARNAGDILTCLLDIQTSQHHKVMHLVNTSLILARRRNKNVQVKSRNRSIHLQVPMDISTRPTFTNPTLRKDIFDFWWILQFRWDCKIKASTNTSSNLNI
jgi:hypothetical protein